ncbi:MAG: hypothetical protein AABX39_06415 [Nanoarchaeota archaeon]
MSLSEKLVEANLMPGGLDLVGKVGYWVAQVGACTFPFAGLYALANKSEVAATITNGSAIMAFGGIVLLGYSVVRKNLNRSGVRYTRPNPIIYLDEIKDREES